MNISHDGLFQNCINGSAAPNRRTARAPDKKSFKQHLLLNHIPKFKIISQNYSSWCTLPKFLKWFHPTDQSSSGERPRTQGHSCLNMHSLSTWSTREVIIILIFDCILLFIPVSYVSPMNFVAVIFTKKTKKKTTTHTHTLEMHFLKRRRHNIYWEEILHKGQKAYPTFANSYTHIMIDWTLVAFLCKTIALHALISEFDIYNAVIIDFCVDSASLATSFKSATPPWPDKGTCREIDNVYQATCKRCS